jgi:hypothetical protein
MAAPLGEFWYSIDDDSERFSAERPSPTDELEWLAEIAAEDYFHNHDGWDASWPTNIAIYEDAEGPRLATFFVEMESRPDFCARRIVEATSGTATRTQTTEATPESETP